MENKYKFSWFSFIVKLFCFFLGAIVFLIGIQYFRWIMQEVRFTAWDASWRFSWARPIFLFLLRFWQVFSFLIGLWVFGVLGKFVNLVKFIASYPFILISGLWHLFWTKIQ